MFGRITVGTRFVDDSDNVERGSLGIELMEARQDDIDTEDRGEYEQKHPSKG